jgi:hypothetical protein
MEKAILNGFGCKIDVETNFLGQLWSKSAV